MRSLPRTFRATALALTLPAALVACGDDDPTGPAGSATVTARMSDGSSQTQTGAAPVGAAAQSSVSGTLSGSAQAYIYSETQGWVALGSASNTSLGMQSAETATVGTATVEADSYTRVRLVLDGFNAQVNAGSALGGLTLDASVSITVGGADGRVEIEKTVTPFSVSANSTTTLDFDLNSETWVDLESAESETASDAEVTSATTAIVTAG